MRSREGFISNANVIQFRTTIKQILLFNSVVSSNKANAVAFEAGTQSSIFSLAIKKKQTSMANLIPKNPKATVSVAKRNFEGLFASIAHSKVTDNILFYISGYITRNPVKSIDFQDCAISMVQSAASTDPQYPATPYANFFNRKNKGDLIQASYGSYKVVAATKKHLH